ncbi:tryptophan synthase subunit beta [Nocardia sp. CA2R105]|uniref:tryptophan synthase subunit beta n=1 Tax=Nocardia coffeae TaxID=2873381 RepID=UPI001CA5FC6C|nr:tryptophan synthase subunit beta [Nocardia coffeae]MBY8859478.1 tryptophan synthase subunit beta [Nocardia coffeae]
MVIDHGIARSHRLGGVLPDERGRFGRYGGRYVPEGLMAALLDLERTYLAARNDPRFIAELDELLRDRVGRPTLLHRIPRFAGALRVPGVRVYLKREDMTHTGAHKINNAIGQALLARRMGKRRIIAETGAGQHGVAVATVCAMLGLSCVVYMGADDMARQDSNVVRMRLLGAEVRAVSTGGRGLKEAVSESVRDWVANLDTSHYVFGTAAGPAPYPWIVREFQTVIGRESRAQILKSEGRLPDYVLACVGGGSNAVGMFHPFVDDPGVRLIGVEAAGRGGHEHAATLNFGRPGEVDGSYSYLLQDEDGQISRTHSIAAGLDYPGVGPELSHLKDAGRAVFGTATDAQALRGLRALSRTEGILPALESAHALGYLLDVADRGELPPDSVVLVCLSGRGDKDLHIAADGLDALESDLRT